MQLYERIVFIGNLAITCLCWTKGEELGSDGKFHFYKLALQK